VWVLTAVGCMQNFTNNRCAGWTWYLSDDMQFYVVAPLVLLVYLRNRILGWVFTGPDLINDRATVYKRDRERLAHGPPGTHFHAHTQER